MNQASGLLTRTMNNDPVPQTSGKPFEAAAARATSRINLVHALRSVRRTIIPICVTGVVLLVAVRLAGYRVPDWLSALALIAGWLGVLAVLTWRRRPTPFAALAAWDEKSQRGEMFASAHFFENKPGALTDGEELHVQRAGERLERDSGRLSTDLPLPGVGWRWALPVVLLALSFSPLLKRQLAAEDRKLSDDAALRAGEEGNEIAKATETVGDLEGLDEKEKDKAEKLAKAIEDTAKKLAKGEGRTPREILEELEKRAQAADSLARELGKDADSGWPSEKMLAEMGKHPDTADLALAMKDRNPKRTSGEAGKVDDKLRGKDLTNEVKKRFDKALSKTMGAATKADKAKVAGRHIGKASKDLGKDAPKDAAQEFKKLADHYKKMARREEARKKLAKLASKLRQSGSRIAGSNMKGMQKLAGNKNKANMQPIAGMNNTNLSPLGAKPGSAAQPGNMLQIPGLKVKKAPPGAQFPIPGKAGLPKPGSTVFVAPGKPKPGAPAIPIPGTCAAGGMIPGAMAGGLQAGVGAAPYGKTAEKPLDATTSGVVAAAIGKDGESAVRAVEGQDRNESAMENRKEVAREFIRVEEEALDDVPLPRSRKEHIYQYFATIRERFEEE